MTQTRHGTKVTFVNIKLYQYVELIRLRKYLFLIYINQTFHISSSSTHEILENCGICFIHLLFGLSNSLLKCLSDVYLQKKSQNKTNKNKTKQNKNQKTKTKNKNKTKNKKQTNKQKTVGQLFIMFEQNVCQMFRYTSDKRFLHTNI